MYFIRIMLYMKKLVDIRKIQEDIQKKQNKINTYIKFSIAINLLTIMIVFGTNINQFVNNTNIISTIAKTSGYCEIE